MATVPFLVNAHQLRKAIPNVHIAWDWSFIKLVFSTQ